MRIKEIGKKIRIVISNILVKVFSLGTDVDDIQAIRKKLPILYFVKTGKKLNLNNPISYSEKIQLYKLWLNDKGFERFVDKLAVSDWVSKKIGKGHIVKVLAEWDDPCLISFANLPKSFVIKCNNGSGMNLIVKDKETANLEKIKAKARKWVKTNFVIQNGFELQYKNVVPKIFAEEYLGQSSDIQEYKFLCFNGRPIFCVYDKDRFETHRRNIYDMNWNLQPWNSGGLSNSIDKEPKPNCFEELKNIVNCLCRSFPHVRVDLYEVHGNIFFSELTFTNGSGYSVITPAEYDRKLGALWDIKELNKNE